MNYNTVDLLSYNILVIILVCARVISGLPAKPIEPTTLSAIVLDLFRTSKCGGHQDSEKIEKYIKDCNGVDPTKFETATDLGPDLCLGLVNNIIASCDKESYDVLEFLSKKNPEKFKNLGANESICPLETLELKPFLMNHTSFNTLSEYLKDNKLCGFYCIFKKNVRDECSLWHKTNAILKNFKNQTSSNSAVKSKPVKSEVASHDNKPITNPPVKTGIVSQQSPVPKPDDIKTNDASQTKNSPDKKEEPSSAIDHPPDKGQENDANKSSVDKEGTVIVPEPKKPSIGKTTVGEAQDRKVEMEPEPEPGLTNDPGVSQAKKNEDDDFENGDQNDENIPDNKDNLDLGNNGGVNDSDPDNNRNFEGNGEGAIIDDPIAVTEKISNENPPKIEDEFSDKNSQLAVPIKLEDSYYNNFDSAPDSHFFYYFLFSAGLVILGYVAFHNKNKVSCFDKRRIFSITKVSRFLSEYFFYNT